MAFSEHQVVGHWFNICTASRAMHQHGHDEPLLATACLPHLFASCCPRCGTGALIVILLLQTIWVNSGQHINTSTFHNSSPINQVAQTCRKHLIRWRCGEYPSSQKHYVLHASSRCILQRVQCQFRICHVLAWCLGTYRRSILVSLHTDDPQDGFSHTHTDTRSLMACAISTMHKYLGSCLPSTCTQMQLSSRQPMHEMPLWMTISKSHGPHPRKTSCGT